MLEPQEGMSLEQIINWAKYAEAEGYGYIFRSDHLLPGGGEEGVRKKIGAESPECWVSLGAIALATSRINFGPLVTPVGFRNPALLARMACTLDSYSSGRMRLGLGAGWYEYEYKTNGYKFPDFKVRRKQLEEAYNIVGDIIKGNKTDFDGEYFSAHVECFPKPAKGKIHLIGGGRNPLVVKTLAKHADEWNVFNCPNDIFQKLRVILDQNKPHDRSIEVSQMLSFIVARTSSELERKLERFSNLLGLKLDPKSMAKKFVSGGRLCGTAEEIVTQLNEKREAGVQKFYFQILDPSDKDMVDLLTNILKAKI